MSGLEFSEDAARQPGYQFTGVSVFPILNLQWNDDSYSKGLATLVRDFVRRRDDVPPEDLLEWYDEFPRLSDAGQYFFSSNRYIFGASKPNE